MRTPSEAIQPTVWLLDGTLPSALRHVQVLKLPAPIWQSISQLEPMAPEVPPVASLHDMLAAFSRRIVAFEPYSERRTSQRWLYAQHDSNLNLEHLQTLIRTWLIACYGEERADAVIDSWPTLNWVWDRLDLQTADVKTKQMLLPGLLARWLLDNGFSLRLEQAGSDSEFPLRLVPLMTQRYKAELITEPIEQENELFSFVMRFWVEPMPGALCLHHRVSVRRWAHIPLINGTWVNLKRGRGKSVFLRRTVGYLDAETDEEITPYDDVFSRITMKYVGVGVDGLRWVGNQARVFESLGLNGAPPPVQTLTENPAGYRDRALITIENRDSKSHKIDTGLQSADHRRIFSDLDRRIGEWAKAMPTWERVDIGDALGERSPSQSSKVKDSVRFEALRAMPHPVRLELHVNDVKGVQETILREVGVFGSYQHQLGDEFVCVMDNNDLLMEIVKGQDATLTALLPENAAQSGEANRRAVQQRQNEIARCYNDTDQPTGALIALNRYDKSPNRATRQRDPKAAIRYGLAEAGRVSQFFAPKGNNPYEKVDGYSHRLTNAVRDLLRVLGYRYNPFYTRIGGLPDHIDIVAFWLIQLYARRNTEQKVILPLVVDAPQGTQHLRMFVPRNTGSADLYPTLREGIVAATKFEGDFAESEVTAFFRDAMALRGVHQPTLLLICDQNLRRVFPELNAQNGAASHIHLNNILAEEASPVRVGRLRSSNDDEAPFCVPVTDMGKYRGLYAHPTFPNVFLSLHNIGDRPASSKWHKLDWTTKPSVNPSTVQIWLNNLQPGDDPAEWAALIHRLRLESSHTNIETVLPQPLHDVKTTVSQYLSRLVDDDTDDDLNAIGAPEQE